MTEGHAIPRTALYAEGTVSYPSEMGIPDQHFVMRSANHPENGQPPNQPSAELKELSLSHGALHEARGERVEDCLGTECSLLLPAVGVVPEQTPGVHSSTDYVVPRAGVPVTRLIEQRVEDHQVVVVPSVVVDAIPTIEGHPVTEYLPPRDV